MQGYVESHHRDDERWAVSWTHYAGQATEQARLLGPVWLDEILIVGGGSGWWNGWPRSYVWHITLRPDWTARHVRYVPDEPYDGTSPDLDLRHDGDRRWFDHRSREQHPDTRDTSFLVVDHEAFWHTPILRHIGLNSTQGAELEVLRLNPANGYAVGVPRRYTPLGGGRWAVTGPDREDTEIVVDEHGLVREGHAALVMKHRPDRGPGEKGPADVAVDLRRRWG